jgi:catechol 2,3-dioxygenase-like lactoylglutathione lyase family enzyme
MAPLLETVVGPNGIANFCDSMKLDQSKTKNDGNMLVTGIDHVQIAAPEGCEAEARNFFGRLLGLEEIEKPEPLRSRGGCWFKVGSRQLHIGIEELFRPATKAHLAFAVNNIESVCAVLKGAGVLCVWDEAAATTNARGSEPWPRSLRIFCTG